MGRRLLLVLLSVGLLSVSGIGGGDRAVEAAGLLDVALAAYDPAIPTYDLATPANGGLSLPASGRSVKPAAAPGSSNRPARVRQSAANSAVDPLTYSSPLSAASFSLTGVSSIRQSDFRIPTYWNVREARVRLRYRLSPLVKEELSSLTLSVNGHPFYSLRPAVWDGTLKEAVLAVPAELLAPGLNRLRVEGRLRQREGDRACQNNQAPEDWLYVDQASAVETIYTRVPWDGSIRDLYRRLSGPDVVGSGLSLVTVPDQTDGSEWEAAVYGLSGIVAENTDGNSVIPLLPYSEANLETREATILMGLYDRLPEEAKALLEPSAVVSLDSQALLQAVSLRGKPVLVATSRSREMLTRAGRLLGNRELMSQLDSAVKLVGPDTAWEAVSPSLQKTIALADTGQELRGAYHQEHTVYIPVPSDRLLADASKIRLDFRYAQNLDFSRSLVTVRVNDTPIGSKKLTSELAEGDTAVFSVPSGVRVSGSFSVTVAFDLEWTEEGCREPRQDTPWAYIAPSSFMQVNTRGQTALLFNSYPYPFVQDGRYSQVAVVLPRERNTAVYRSVSNLFSLLGRYAGGNTGEVRFLEDSAGAEMLKERNVIAVGGYAGNAVIRGVNGQLYFRYDGSGSRLLSNEKMSISEEYGARIGTLQLIESPFSETYGLLAVTGADPASWVWSSALLSGESARWKVYGDGVVADRDGQVYAYRFKKDDGSQEGSLADRILARRDATGFTVAAVLMVLLLLVSLLLLLRKHAPERRKRS